MISLKRNKYLLKIDLAIMTNIEEPLPTDTYNQLRLKYLQEQFEKRSAELNNQ